jgi:glycosyltransferase involved in cell wall biosynthesis
MAQVAVIMTAYNCENYIGLAISSTLNQTFKDFEFIIVDDGSTDRTKEIIAAFDDPRITIYSLDHIGRARALNYAVRKAQSPYIAFMDADDISVPERIEKQYIYLHQNPQVGIVSSWFQLIDYEGGKLNVIRKLPEHHTQIEYQMTVHCSMCFGCSMIRSKLIQQAGEFNNQLGSAIDYDLFVRLLPLTEFHNLQHTLFYCRIHSSALTSSRNKEQLSNTFIIAKQYLEILLKRASSQEAYKIYFRLGVNEYYRGTIHAARQYFLSALPELWREWSLWRYFLPMFLGDTIISRYRKHLKRKYAGTPTYE